MASTDLNRFELLKKKIVATMQHSFPGIRPEMADWKSREITDFQEELRIKIKASVSEKWFYDHFKKKDQPLPRIDMLNILSRYAGYLNWDHFITVTEDHELPSGQIKSGNRIFIVIPTMVTGAVLILVIAYQLVSYREYQFSFYDALTKERIQSDKIEVVLLSGKKAPMGFITDSSGVCILKTGRRFVTLLITAPYYKTDTVSRILKTFESSQKIGLRPDEYARMISYFSEMKLDDWQKRRASLDSIIDNGAMICQVGSGSRKLGVELFGKQEFIDKLTMPSGSLRNIDILETKLLKGKIVVLRFRVEETMK